MAAHKGLIIWIEMDKLYVSSAVGYHFCFFMFPKNCFGENIAFRLDCQRIFGSGVSRVTRYIHAGKRQIS